MLPINTQASSTEDRHIIAASLKRQEEEAYKQTKILEKLADEFGKQRRASVKQNTNKKAETSTKGPGFFDMPLQDLKQMFVFDSGYKNKQNKQNTLKDIPQTLKFDSGQKSNNKQDTNKDENSDKKSQGVFKNMIENITDSNAKKEISETRKKLDNIVETPSEGDKVKKSIETAQEPPVEDKLKKSGDMENEETTQTERKSHVPFSQKIKQSFSEKMTNSMAGATTKDFSQLLTTKEYKEFTKKQTDRIVDALEGLDIGGSGSDSGGIGIPGLDVDSPDGKDDKKKGRKGRGRGPRPGTPKPGMPKPGVPPIPATAAAAVTSAAVVTGVLAAGTALTIGATNTLESMSDEQLEQLSQDRGSDTALAAQVILSGRATEEEKAAEKKRIDQKKQDLKDAPILTKYYDVGTEEYMKEMEDKKKREETKKRVKELVQQSKDKELNKNRIFARSPGDEMSAAADESNRNFARSPGDEMSAAAAAVTTTAPKLLDTVNEQKQELEDTKAATAPITVINNNTNNVGGGGGQSMSFASASAVNLDTAINDFFRSHGRIFA